MTMKDVVDAIGEPCWHRAYVERLIPQLLTPANDAEANAVRMRGASGQLRGAMARIDELEREAGAGLAYPVEVDLEGRRDRKDPGIRYLGKAIRQSNGEYYVLADVHGSLCRVAVSISFDASSTVEQANKAAPSVDDAVDHIAKNTARLTTAWEDRLSNLSEHERELFLAEHTKLSSSMPMGMSPQPMRCKTCHHEWIGWEASTCPKFGRHKTMMDLSVIHEKNMRALGHGPPGDRHNLGSSVTNDDPDMMKDEYDFRGGARGRFFRPGFHVSVVESSPVAIDEPGSAGKRTIVDVAAIVESCRRIINNRPGDASPPTAVISADVLLSVACLLLDLQYAVREKREAIALTLSNRGPSIGGPAVADAVGSVVESVQDWIRLRRGQILMDLDLTRVAGPGGGVLTKEGRVVLEGLVKVYESGPGGLCDAIAEGLSALDGSRHLAPEYRSVLENHRGAWFGPAGHVSDLLASIDRVATIGGPGWPLRSSRE
jgi:hypothetical protein